MNRRALMCTFWLGADLFGIPVDRVQEILRGPEISPVPLAPAAMLGLINLRGEIVTAIDLARRLSLPAKCQGGGQLVVRDGHELVSLVVDRIADVVEAGGALEDPPETLPALTRELVAGVFVLPSRLLLVLDLDRAIDLPKG